LSYLWYLFIGHGGTDPPLARCIASQVRLAALIPDDEIQHHSRRFRLVVGVVALEYLSGYR
jgi:hypothetical protein